MAYSDTGGIRLSLEKYICAQTFSEWVATRRSEQHTLRLLKEDILKYFERVSTREEDTEPEQKIDNKSDDWMIEVSRVLVLK
jgi:hypothetical protein